MTRMTTKAIEELHERLTYIAGRLTYDSGAPPATFAVLSDALDELAALRTQAQTLTAERDQWKQAAELARAGDEMKALHGLDMQRKATESEREACAKACEANARAHRGNGMVAYAAHVADARDIRGRGK